MSENSLSTNNPISSRVDSTDQDAIRGMFSVIVGQMYQEPLNSCIREITSNALDASMAYGSSSIDLSYNSSTQVLSIRDYGSGMSPEFMKNQYSKVFSSDKRNDSTQIGSYGIGRLSVLAYRSYFFLTTIYGEKQYNYKVYLDNKIPTHVLLESFPTKEAHGTEVKIPNVSKSVLGDACCFLVKQAAFSQISFNFQDELELLNDLVKVKRNEIAKSGKQWCLNKNSNNNSFGVALYVDGILYNVNLSLFHKSNIPESGYYSKELMLPTLPIANRTKGRFPNESLTNSLSNQGFFDSRLRSIESPYSSEERLYLFTTSDNVNLTSSREALIEDNKTIETINQLYFNFVFEFIELVKNKNYCLDKLTKENDYDFYKSLLNLEVISLNDYKVTSSREKLCFKIDENNFKAVEYTGDDLPSQGVIPFEIVLSRYNVNCLYLYLITNNFENPTNITSLPPTSTHEGKKINDYLDSEKTLRLQDLIKLKIVIVSKRAGITPKKFVEKNNIDSKGKDILIIRDESDLDIYKLFKPFVSLRDMGILDVEFIEPKKTVSKSNNTSSGQFKPNLKSTRKKVQKIRSKNHLSLTINSTRLNDVNKYKYVFGNDNNENLLEYEEIPKKAYYIEKSKVSIDFVRFYANDILLFKDHEDLYLLADNSSEQLLDMLQSNTNTKWYSFYQMLEDKLSNKLTKIYQSYNIKNYKLVSNLRYYELLNYLVTSLSTSRYLPFISLEETDLVRHFFCLNEVFKLISVQKGYSYDSDLSNLITYFSDIRLSKKTVSITQNKNLLWSIEYLSRFTTESNFTYFDKVRNNFLEERNTTSNDLKGNKYKKVESCINLLSVIYNKSLLESYYTLIDVSKNIFDTTCYNNFCYYIEQVKRIIKEYV